VPLRHDAVVNLATAMAAETDLGPADAILVLPSTAVGAAPLELWMALVTGARIVVAPAVAPGDGATLSRLIAAEGVTFLHAPPATWETLVETGLRPRRSLTAMSGGDPLGRDLADRILSRCRTLWQAYGVPEATVYSTLGRVAPSGPVTIGRPIANTRIHIIDAAGRPVPIGVPGELLIAGAGVAGRYLNEPTAGSDGFIADPLGPGVAYRTGRQARWLPRGELELRA
jgi:non-ribosomal peptide synthetase component F